MSGSQALQKLAEQISTICSDYRRLHRRCAELERKVEKLSQRTKNLGGPVANEASEESTGEAAGPLFDKESIKTKVEEMLAELADIG